MQWDARDDLGANHEHMCGRTDQPVTALLTDLKRTGLLDETLVIQRRRVRQDPGGARRQPSARSQRNRLYHVYDRSMG